MNNSGFIFKKWETRVPYYALIKLEEEKICALEETWAATRRKGVRVALTTTFAGGWSLVVKEVGKQSLKYGGRKALGFMTLVAFGYAISASMVIITKSAKVIKYAKVCHSACSSRLDMAELCASAPINMLEILIFGRPVVIEDGGFDLFSKDADPLDAIEKLVGDKIK